MSETTYVYFTKHFTIFLRLYAPSWLLNLFEFYSYFITKVVQNYLLIINLSIVPNYLLITNLYLSNMSN